MKYDIKALRRSMADIQNQMDKAMQANMDLLISQLRKNDDLRSMLVDKEDDDIKAIAQDLHNILKREEKRNSKKKKTVVSAKGDETESSELEPVTASVFS